MQFLNSIAPNIDFTTVVNNEVVFAIGECTKDVNISILYNEEREDDEKFNVSLATDCCADITIGEVEVTITESGHDSKENCLQLLPLYCFAVIL